MATRTTSSRRTIEERRAAILETAIRLFARDGFHKTDVQEIANEAEVGKGTVYRHFGSKERLFLATSRHCMEMLDAFVRNEMGDDDVVASTVEKCGVARILMDVAVACAEFYQQHPESVEIMLYERAEFRDQIPTHLLFRSERRDAIDQFIEAAVQTGEFRHVNVREATNAWCDLIFGCAVSGCLEGSPTTLDQRMRHAMDIFLNGLTTNGDA